MIREPAVAGMFYDANPNNLLESLDASFLGPYGPGRLPAPAPLLSRDIVGLVSPHAGYQFSGYAAAASYFELAEDGLPDTAILIGPNHRGTGSPAAIMTSGTWRTPLGDAEIDSEIACAMLESSDLLREDARAHASEHSLEVQVPFLQYLSRKIKIVPVLLSILAWEDAPLYAENIGRGIAEAIGEKNVVVVASTDFSHYEPKAVAEENDRRAIDAIETQDYKALLDVVSRRGISMCGVVPTAATLVACAMLGAKRARLLAYYTSADIIGDTSQVVGYGALKIVRE